MKIRIPKTLAARLTLWYASIFSLSFAIIFVGMYLYVGHILTKHVEEEILEDAMEYGKIFQSSGLDGLKEEIMREMDSDGPEKFLVRIFDKSGNLLFHTDSSSWGRIPDPAPPTEHTLHVPVHKFSIAARGRAQGRYAVFPAGDYYVQIAMPLGWDVVVMAPLRAFFGWGTLLTLLAAAATGWLLARKSCRQIEGINEVAQSIATGKDLSRRVPVRGERDEIDRLANTFNFMLSKIEAFIWELTDMIDNAAHDLKTPLARIRSAAETSMPTSSNEILQGTFVQIMDECDRFLGLLNTIMDISEARTGMMKLQPESVPIADLFCEMEELFMPVAEEKGLELAFLPVSDAVPDLYVDKKRIMQVLANIIDNAIKFTPEGGRVAVWAESGDDSVSVLVRDTGTGIEPDHLPRIFERFYRAESSRSMPGKGLGLSLAKAYIEAHNGSISVETETQKGSTFRLIFPLNPNYSSFHPQPHDVPEHPIHIQRAVGR